MKQVDVAIVGGGPAGTSAGYAAANRGADAVVIEKGVPRADREGLGPDSTDAAGFLDYWVDIAGLDVDALPDDVILQELDDAEFIGPSESVTLTSTGIPSSYDGFGFTFQRARLDDYLRSRAEAAGAEYAVGSAVVDVQSDLTGTPEHTLTLANGEQYRAPTLVLADGPQRQVTMRVLDQWLPDNSKASTKLSPPSANHIAYQEYRELPEAVFDPTSIKFWWGWMPGETAYPWIFPNDGTVARVGLTMPIGMALDDVENPEDYRLLHADDDRIPQGKVYIRRLLEELYGDEYDIEADFPLVEDGRGKSKGTETYPISSTRPIESPVDANVAVVGGAMGATSAFHEGGDHVAMRTGTIAGDLAAVNDLDRYNDAWQNAIGEEILRNVSFADVVRDFTPAQWDTTFGVVNRMLAAREERGPLITARTAATGWTGLKLFVAYKHRKWRYRNGRYAQIRATDYEV
jgi:electron-transferring-flavoprotein dehydrogenase